MPVTLRNWINQSKSFFLFYLSRLIWLCHGHRSRLNSRREGLVLLKPYSDHHPVACHQFSGSATTDQSVSTFATLKLEVNVITVCSSCIFQHYPQCHYIFIGNHCSMPFNNPKSGVGKMENPSEQRDYFSYKGKYTFDRSVSDLCFIFDLRLSYLNKDDKSLKITTPSSLPSNYCCCYLKQVTPYPACIKSSMISSAAQLIRLIK